MKKMGLISASVLTIAASAAQADLIRLADVYTNDCSALQSEVRLLDGREARVQTYCDFGSFIGPNGQRYNGRLNTTVEVPYHVFPGTRIQLTNIDTNRCDRAQGMIELLNSREAQIDTYCESGSFLGHNGQYYRFRLNTSIITNF